MKVIDLNNDAGWKKPFRAAVPFIVTICCSSDDEFTPASIVESLQEKSYCCCAEFSVAHKTDAMLVASKWFETMENGTDQHYSDGTMSVWADLC
jgi:hypothetical protein